MKVLILVVSFAMLTDANINHTVASNGTSSNIPLRQFLEPVYFFSGIFTAVLSMVATFGNGFLLLAIWKDPYKTFRVPSTVFVIGLSVADFLTGFLVGPIIAYIRIASSSSRDTNTFFLLQTGKTMSFLTMNSSYLVLLFLTWNQFAAIRFPHQYRSFLNTRKVTICVVGVWVYAGIFSLLPFCGINAEIVYKLDFYMHTTVFIVLLVIAYFCLFVAFQKQVQRIALAAAYDSGNGTRRQICCFTQRRKRSERQFTTVTLVLVLFIIVCTLPSFVVQFLDIYWKPPSFEEMLRFMIALEVCSDVQFLKFALDPFIYCWRLTSYRKALKSVVFGRMSLGRNNRLSVTQTAQPRARQNGSVSLVSGMREAYMMRIHQNDTKQNTELRE